MLRYICIMDYLQLPNYFIKVFNVMKNAYNVYCLLLIEKLQHCIANITYLKCFLEGNKTI